MPELSASSGLSSSCPDVVAAMLPISAPISCQRNGPCFEKLEAAGAVSCRMFRTPGHLKLKLFLLLSLSESRQTLEFRTPLALEQRLARKGESACLTHDIGRFAQDTGMANMKQRRHTYFSLDLPDDESPALAIANRLADFGLRTVKVFDDEGNRVVPRERAIRPPQLADPEDKIRRH